MTALEAINYLSAIPAQEPVFILRAQDILAPHCVSEWARLFQSMGGGVLKAEEARAVAEQMVKWGGRKFPD